MFGKKKKATASQALHLEEPDYTHIVRVEGLVHDFVDIDEEGKETERFRAVDKVSLDVSPGQFIAVLGHNGSGKSTLAKHLNAILYPTEGTVWVDGKDTRDDTAVWDIRQTAGMVFQNPDNQIIGQIVEEDVGFGPENIGVATEDIWRRVDESLEAVGMTAYRYKSPNKLSGGQKQRTACARAMVAGQSLLLCDEPTGALDSKASKNLLEIMTKMNRDMGATILTVTHDAFSASYAGRVLFLKDGRIFNELLRGERDRPVLYHEILDVLAALGGDVSDVI